MVIGKEAQAAPEKGGLFGGRFRAASVIKSAHGVTTLLGVDDADHHREVVIKTTRAASVPAGAQMRLEHEARALREVRSPFLTPLLDFGHEGDALYLVTPYVKGPTLAERLRRGPLAPRDAIEVARTVLAALDEAHGRGVLHRDVKPANVVIEADRAPPRARLIDFGFARSVWLDESLREDLVGTARYMSPEQAGLLESGVDVRADLYSTGALLFECLAGRPPFEGLAMGDLLRQHLSAPPPELRARAPSCPRALEEVVQRLLRKDPRDRYQSAHAAIRDLDEIAEALDRGVADPPVTIGLHDARETLTEPSFIGRTAELDALKAALERAKGGSGGLVTLEAPSGGGKTRLLEELARRSSSEGAWVLRGQAFDQVAHRPFQLLNGVVGGIVSAAAADPALGRRLRERLGDRRETVTSILPRLADVLGGGPSAPVGPEAYGEMRGLPALSALLDALGAPERAAVVVLDDVQWADEMTVRLLAHWQGEPRASRVLVVAAFRSEEVPQGHRLRALAASSHVALAPLQEEDVRRLLSSMAGSLPPEIISATAGLSQGSPFMAAAVLRGLAETGALLHEGGRWRADAGALADACSSRAAAAFLARRVSWLPEAAQRLLAVGAVLGKSFDIELGAELANEPSGTAIAAIDEARRRHIVFTDSHGARASFVHDKLREALLERLSPDERRRLHLAAATEIESRERDRIFELAYHFDAAGEGARALPYALVAAERARAQHALEVAERQYRIARAGSEAPPADGSLEAQRGAEPDAIRERVAEGLGDVLMLRGRYEEAARELEAALLLARDDRARARIETKLGELAFKRGDMDAAIAPLERALSRLGRFVPRSAVDFTVLVVWEVLVQAAHSLFPRFFLGKRGLLGADDDRLAMRVLSRLAHAYWFQRGSVACLWAHLREMNLAERYAETPELAQAYSEHAPAMTLVPWIGRGIAYVERSLAIRRRLGDLWGEGQSQNFHGVVLYCASRFKECIERCREAGRLLDRTGDRWEANVAEWHIAICHYRLGELDEAVERSRRVHAIALAIGDHQASGIAVSIWAKASGGRVPCEIIGNELARKTGDVHTRSEVLQAEALRLLGEDRALEAAQVLEEAERLVDAAGLKQEYVAPIKPWLATALRRAAEEAPALAGEHRRELISRARRASRRALAIARRYPNNLPHALREAGLVAALEGRTRRAHALFDRSLELAEAQEARLEAAETRLARSRLALATGSAGGEVGVAEARARLRALGARGLEGAPDVERREDEVTLSLADRFASVLLAGRRIASSLTREQVFEAVVSAAGSLLRGERCIVLDVSKGAEGAVRVAGSGDFSRTLVREAVSREAPVVHADGQAPEPSESMLLAGVRSALCAPIAVRGRVESCFVVTHGRIGGLFGATEERLAAFIAALAGAALENAQGVARSEALSSEREQLWREAQEAVRVRDEFLSIASHELKTPLTALLLQIAMLRRRGRGAPGTSELAELVDRQAHRLARLIDDLLDISRIAAGRISLEVEDVDLVAAARDAVERWREEAARLGSTILLDAPPELLGRLDRLRVDQVLENLLANAVKYGAGQPIDVRIEHSGTRARIVVQDRGIGIAREDQARIFGRFERAVSTRHFGGFGLGLWIVRQVLDACGGRISLESEPGKGATFTVDVPLGGPHGAEGKG